MADGVRWSGTGRFASLQQTSDIDEGEEAQNKAIKSRIPHNSRFSSFINFTVSWISRSAASARKLTEYSLRDFDRRSRERAILD
jgi:hypothetical protein